MTQPHWTAQGTLLLGHCPISRRDLLSLMAFALVPLNGWSQAQTLLDEAEQVRVLASFCDLLIPADDLTPSASNLDIHRRIHRDAQGEENYARFIETGCRWLNVQADGDFPGFDPKLQPRVLIWMERSDRKGLPYRFFRHLRRLTITHYYADPRAWKGLGLDHPPQPEGFMDYAG